VPHVVMIDMPVLLSAVSAVIKHAMTTMRYLRARGQLNGCCGQPSTQRGAPRGHCAPSPRSRCRGRRPRCASN
jgi:hypothetical protein